MDQIDLFTPETNLEDFTPTTPDVTPQVKTTPNQLGGLWDYVLRNQQLIWPGEDHRKRSMAQLLTFLKFDPKYQAMSLTDFGTDEIDAFVLHLLNSGQSKATVNRYSATLSRLFNYAYKKRKYPYPVKMDFFTEKDRNRVRVYSDSELAQIKDWFLDNDNEWLWKMCVVASKAGMRRMEIVSLGREVRGKMTLLSDDKKWLYIPPEIDKTKKGRKVAVNNPELLEAIEYLQVSLAYMWSDKTFLPPGWGKMKYDLFRNDSEAVFHAMRHTCASKMANELQINSIVIAQALGHSNIATTAKYVHANDDALLTASARM